ncbi:MAG: peptidoglycan-binding protein [Verrucomicrobiae bacterium]|nr:peptidoglycan-binding protein [Verrucomicrobiae bacterium]
MKAARQKSLDLTSALRAEYIRLFEGCVIGGARFGEVEAAAGRVWSWRARYSAVAAATGVPWFVIGAIHSLESGCDFGTHLHNGDPRSRRTTHAPRGRPVAGTPPFAWEESARDAIQMHGLDAWRDWSIAGTLYQLERYNGWGYRLYHPNVLSPYLWAGSGHYIRGKYAADGRWSPMAVSQQVGAAVLLTVLRDAGRIRFARRPRKLSLVPTPPQRRGLPSRTTEPKP